MFNCLRRSKTNKVSITDEIIEAADGNMIARGDMVSGSAIWNGSSLPKMIITKVNAAGKVVITATNMLETMTENHVQLFRSIWRLQRCYRWYWCYNVCVNLQTVKYPLGISYNNGWLIDKNAPTFLTNTDVWTQIHLNVTLRQKLWLRAKMLNSMDIKLVRNSTKTGHTARLISKYRPNADILHWHLTRIKWTWDWCWIGVLSHVDRSSIINWMTCLKLLNVKQLKQVCTICDDIVIVAGVP